jgi:hypothetical protein
VTSEVFGSRPKAGSFCSAIDVQWPQFKQSIAIRVMLLRSVL